MAYVFGNAVTDATLRAMPEFQGKKTTLQDKARVALTLKHSDGKDVAVREQVQNLTAGGERTTICLIYNATGDTLTLVNYQDWIGHVGSSPYPPLIGNGQWGVFLHVGDESAAYSSAGAVFYRGKNKDGQDRDWMQAWSNTRKANKVRVGNFMFYLTYYPSMGGATHGWLNDIRGVQKSVKTEIN
ncbi:hypothetical protein GQ457_05G035340 [Hibiscus cannabinus]